MSAVAFNEYYATTGNDEIAAKYKLEYLQRKIHC